MAPPRRILRQQLEILIEFLESNKDMSKGLPPGPPITHQVTRQKWAVLAKKLNAVPSGALKAPDGWKKYWFEWRHKCRKKAANARRLQSSAAPHKCVPLNDLEIRVLDLNGDGSVGAAITSSQQLHNFLDKEQPDHETRAITHRADTNTGADVEDAGERSVTPPPKWALQLEERRIEAAERTAAALESIAAMMRAQEVKRNELEDRLVDMATTVAGNMEDLCRNIRDVIQNVPRKRIKTSPKTPVQEVVFL